ncbi:hypothetical protein ACIHIX_04925 [Streptomyces sp. NPDC051913]|uniref:hypothetical protein n=1 Tax=Streptomyces sp. NPDC051913 TaxID=3365676 RepID=UPI0037D27246
MRAATKGTVRSTRARLLGVLALLVALFATVTPTAEAAGSSADTQAAYLAEQLRTSPVYVTDQLPREIPKSTTPSFAKVAQRTGVPTYVLVLPLEATDGEALLGAVHDRLGKKGLYVLIDDSSVTNATAYGVSAPADDAVTTATYELPYDAGPLRSFERFVEAVTEDDDKAAARAEAARDKYDADGEPADLYIGPSDRDDQSFLTGMAITGVPLAMLLLIPYVRRWWRRRPGAAPVSLTKRPSTPRRPTRLLLPLAAAATAVAIASTAPHVFDQTTSSASPRPRAIDLNARIDRVVEGLARDPIYQDAESPRALDRTQLTQLRSRIVEFSASTGGGPVFMALVPQLYEDESGSDEEYFAYAVHDKLGKDGVYIVADPLDGYINVFNYGLGLDSYGPLYDLPESVTYGDEKSDTADDHLLAERLTTVMTALDKTERTDEPTTPGDPYPLTDPITEDELNPLFYGDFWPGLFVGALAAGAALALVAAALGIVRKSLLRRNPEPLPTSALPTASPAMPTKPYLHDTARIELQALAREFGTGETADTRARNRYDATMLLATDGETLDELAPATLTAVIVLARATRAALSGDDSTLCCGVNPLHGPARTRRHVRTSSVETRRRMLPLCPVCLDDPHKIPARLLKLPPNGLPYYEDELLSAVPEGFTKLGRKVREATNVR